MAIFLIRHGETALNAARVIQQPETPLSERGLAQAEALGRRLAGEGVAAVLSSDYERAAMTAERVVAHTGAPLEHDPVLRERHFGELRGTPYAELDCDPFAEGYEPPGGESWETFHARVDRVWERMRGAAAATRGNLAVVTHGLVCHSLARRHLSLAPGTVDVLAFGNTCLTVIDAAPPWRVSVLACTAHLDARDASDGAPA